MSNLNNLFDDDDEYTVSNSVKYDSSSFERLDFDTLTNLLSNIDLSKEDRLILCNKYIIEDSLTLLECINNILSLYLDNHLHHFRDIIKEFVEMYFLPFPIRIKCAQTMVENDEEVPDVFEKNKHYLLDLQLYICRDVINRPRDAEFNHTLLFEILVRLVSDYYQYSNEINEECISLLIQVLTTLELEESYRFTLFQYAKKNMTDHHNIIIRIAKSMLNCITNSTYGVLLGQLIPVSELDISYMKELIKTDKDAGEICDFFLYLNLDEELNTYAKERLSSIKGVSKNVFESVQNLHEMSADIESFVTKIMEFNVTSSGTLLYLFPEHEDVINRIILDNTLYSTKAVNIITLMGKVWTCIQSHESREELEKRFAQELTDMRDTCTSGHLFRLMNVFSGWMEGIKLDIKIEIRSIVFYRLQKLIESLDEIERDKIIEELGISSEEDIVEKAGQQTIQSHLYKLISELHDELIIDYKTLLDPQQFSEYFRNSILEFTIELNKK